MAKATLPLVRGAGRLTVAIVCAAAALTACSSAGDGESDDVAVVQPGKPGETNRTLEPGQVSSAVPSTQPSDSDFRYVQDMIVHHGQALTMADLAPQRAGTEPVRAMASRIADAQRPEIDMMNAWLRKHGRPEVEMNPSGHHHEGHDPATMPGMATEAQLAELAAASGPAFDALFLKLMIAHHTGALVMADKVRTDGGGVDVKVQEMADDVTAVQTAEIQRMRQLGG